MTSLLPLALILAFVAALYFILNSMAPSSYDPGVRGEELEHNLYRD